MPHLLASGLVTAESSDSESDLAPLAETGLPAEGEREDGMLDQDIYGYAIKCLVRDVHTTSMDDQVTQCLRHSRMMLALGVLYVCIGIQLLLLIQTKVFLTTKAVHVIREVYNEFQTKMYGDDPSHMEVTKQGFTRGRREFFQPELFESMEPDFQDTVCMISLSQPKFLGMVLLVWTLSCSSNMKRVLELFTALVIRLPTVAKPGAQLKVADRKDPEEERERNLLEFQGLGFSELQASGLCAIVSKIRRKDREKVIVIAGLTACTKVLVATCVLLPRLVLNCIVLWLGCRWITATTNFDELLLNAVALQFIINFKDLMYHGCVSAQGKYDISMTRIRQHQASRSHAPGCWLFVGTFLWGVAAGLWAFLYMFQLQPVLPAYRWDVHGVCKKLIQQRYSE